MNRRSLITLFAVAGATAAILYPLAGEAMPIAPTPLAAASINGSAVATDADIAAAQPQKTYWVWHRRHYWHRHYWHRHYWHRHYWHRRHW